MTATHFSVSSIIWKCLLILKFGVNNLLLDTWPLAGVSDCHPIYIYIYRSYIYIYIYIVSEWTTIWCCKVWATLQMWQNITPVNFRIYILVKFPRVLTHWRSWAFRWSELDSDATELHTCASAVHYPVWASWDDQVTQIQSQEPPLKFHHTFLPITYHLKGSRQPTGFCLILFVYQPHLQLHLTDVFACHVSTPNLLIQDKKYRNRIEFCH